MPLFRVQVQPKESQPEEDRAQGVGRRGAESVRREVSPSGVPALAAGVAFGFLLVVGVSFFLIRQSRSGPQASLPGPGAASAPAPVSDGGAGAALGAPTDGAPSDAAIQAAADSALDQTAGPSSINPDYRLEDVIAQVNGQSVAMRDLDRAVRVSRVLGQLSGDPVPANDTSGLRQFQIQMLKRLVDLELMKQAAQRDNMLVPGGTTDTAVQQFLAEVGKSQSDLDAAMAANNVTQPELDRWFRDARTASFFVAQKLMVGNETGDRDQITQNWLTNQWKIQDIGVNFYEPDATVPPGPTGAP
jgi:hypothetical protein